MSQAIVRFYRNVELQELAGDWVGVAKEIHDHIAHDWPDGSACSQGCNHCCKLRVEVLPTEAHRLVDHVRRNLPPAQRQAILDGIKVRAMVASSVDHVEYRKRNLPCVFLSEDGACSVYAIRPITCRSFGSTDAGYCAEPPDVEVEGEELPTFHVHPTSLLTLVATSGLWWQEMNNAMLGVWSEGGVKVEVPASEVLRVQAAQQIADAAIAAEQRQKKGSVIIPVDL